MGSVVAARWVAADERCRSLVLGGVGDHIADGFRASVGGVVGAALLADSPADVPDDRLWQMRSSLADKGNDLRSLAALDTAGQDDPTPAQLAAMGVPTLVLTGAEDWFVGPPDHAGGPHPRGRGPHGAGRPPDRLRHPGVRRRHRRVRDRPDSAERGAPHRDRPHPCVAVLAALVGVTDAASPTGELELAPAAPSRPP